MNYSGHDRGKSKNRERERESGEQGPLFYFSLYLSVSLSLSLSLSLLLLGLGGGLLGFHRSHRQLATPAARIDGLDLVADVLVADVLAVNTGYVYDGFLQMYLTDHSLSALEKSIFK